MNGIVLVFYYCIGKKKQHILASLRKAEQNIFVPSGLARGFLKSFRMSRRGNCLDNAATEQAFGHMKDEFFRGQCWDCFDAFKSDLTAYIAHWNTKRPQERLDGYAPSEYRQRYVKAE